jgi:hypothetical protein
MYRCIPFLVLSIANEKTIKLVQLFSVKHNWHILAKKGQPPDLMHKHWNMCLQWRPKNTSMETHDFDYGGAAVGTLKGSQTDNQRTQKANTRLSFHGFHCGKATIHN